MIVSIKGLPFLFKDYGRFFQPAITPDITARINFIPSAIKIPSVTAIIISVVSMENLLGQFPLLIKRAILRITPTLSRSYFSKQLLLKEG